MWLAATNLIPTTQILWDNLQNLGVFAAMVSGNIDKINSEIDQNYSQIVAQIIFEAYSIIPCYNFTTYMK